jgi:DNA repair protein RadC
VIIVHNHPSGDPTPSPDDVRLTSDAAAAGRLLEIPVLDHVIVAGSGFVSLRAHGLRFDSLRRTAR